MPKIQQEVVKKSKKLTKIIHKLTNWGRESSYLLKSWRNFNEMLGENVAYNNVKNDLKTVSPFFLEIFFWEKP